MAFLKYQFFKMKPHPNAAIKMIWNLHFQAHTAFIEPLTNCPHLQAMLHSRYVGFSHSLSKSRKDQVKLLFSLVSYDLTSQTGNNLKYLGEKYSKI